MHTCLIAALFGAICLAAWLYLLLLHGGFWRTSRTRFRCEPTPLFTTAKVVAIVPARNESETIGRCVASLLSQSVSSLHVVVVDDGSTDGTADRACQAAKTLDADHRLMVLTGAPLPRGWSGKVWAMHQGEQAASHLQPDYLLLTDADIEHSSGNLSCMLSKAQGGFELVSQMVRLQCQTVAEKLFIPAFIYFFFQLYPPAWIADRERSTAGAAGGCILLRTDALARAAGFEAIRSAIIDDCALARAMKRSGSRIYLGLSDSAWSLRGYGTASEIAKMISRTAFNQLRHSLLLLMVALLAMLLVYLLPLALPFVTCRVASLAGLAAWVLMTVSYAPTVRFFRLNYSWALTLPLAALFYMCATLQSAGYYYLGHGGQWKGRIQDRPPGSKQV